MSEKIIYYEPNVFKYKLGLDLKKKFDNARWIPVENHNNIPELRNRENKDFREMKKYIIIGVRKTHKYVPNHKTSDFLVPYTSSGCSASCLYCYLVCNYNKCSYLRLFVNREEMLQKIIRTSNDSTKELTFEIGSNSDLILENSITGNLLWTIEHFGKNNWGYLTFPTKFAMVEDLLNLNHNGKIIPRMSVNPQKIVKEIEIGTSPLLKRIEAINKLAAAGYKVGLLIAPVIMVDNWKNLYAELLDLLETSLSAEVKSKMFMEVIFMTYSFVHRKINEEAFPEAADLYDKKLMTGRGRGRYIYRKELRHEGEIFLREEIGRRFPRNEIVYVV